MARRLDGIDLSPLMIERAKGRSIYRELSVADIESFLENSRRKYDLLIAADTLVYFGDLSRLFRAARAKLKPEGNFLFTAEKQGEDRFALGPRRRYRHSDDYLRASAESAGLACIGMLDCSPRSDAGEPVERWRWPSAASEVSFGRNGFMLYNPPPGTAWDRRSILHD